MLRVHGVTSGQWDLLCDRQGGRCAICRKLPQGKANGRARFDREARLHIDHCHATGKVRGLLCSNCNTMIGLAGEDPTVLLAAITYLSGE